MRHPSYGVKDPALLCQWLSPYERFIWVAASCKNTAQIAGCFRLETDYDLSRFHNIQPSIKHTCRPPYRVVDIGAGIVEDGKKRGLIFEGLFTLTLRLLLEAQVLGVYIQVQLRQVEQYMALGFRPITTPFQPEGFSSWWQGLLLRLEETPAFADPSFQNRWIEETGIALRISFWQRVLQRVESPEGWNKHT